MSKHYIDFDEKIEVETALKGIEQQSFEKGKFDDGNNFTSLSQLEQSSIHAEPSFKCWLLNPHAFDKFKLN